MQNDAIEMSALEQVTSRMTPSRLEVMLRSKLSKELQKWRVVQVR